MRFMTVLTVTALSSTTS